MIISGSFRDYKNRLVTVTITTDSNPGQTLNIDNSNIIWFSGDPVEINESVDNSFEQIIRKSATINFVTAQYLGQLFFANNSRSSSVEITRTENNVETILFSGYIDPNIYNQPYTSPLDEFSINCIDKLSTLQYYNYKNITVNNFDVQKNLATNVTFKSLLDNVIDGLSFDEILYDKSKGISSSRLTTIFDDLTISELNIIGESADDVWTNEELLAEMLKYLNLHIRQIGNSLYIFDWASIRNQKTDWFDLLTNTNKTLSSATINLKSEMHSDMSTNLTIDEVYNQIAITCDLEEQETVISSPLDSDQLTSLYTGKQLYMTEYISEGTGDKANSAFNAIVQGNTDPYKDCKTVDWFIQAMTTKNWRFYYDGVHVVDQLAEKSGSTYINQWKIAKYLKDNPCVPYIFKFGSVEHKNGGSADNSPISKVSMTPYLYISINGNENSAENNHLPSDATIQQHSGMCEFIGNNAGGVFSPTDDDTINYLVFSGKMLFQPIQYESSTEYATRNNNFESIRNGHARKTEGHALVPDYDEFVFPILGQRNIIKSQNYTDGRYYTRKFYTQTYPTDKPVTYLTDGSASLQPWTQDKSAKGYEYKYSSTGNGDDLYKKIPMLECELIIGNKRLVEENIDEYGNSTFKWYELGQEPTITVDGQDYTLTTFSLGVNPKINDFIIGQEYDIQNTIDYTMNVDAEGTAIPIRKSDNISGQVIFRILGPVNCLWNEITRRHPSFWNHTHWTENSRFLLAHTENIIIQDFECKIYSNNGLLENYEDNDLIYMSDETEDYINKKDDIDFKFITQLTSAECLAKGLNQSVNLNAVINSTNNLPITGIYNIHETTVSKRMAKAEEHYINQYYLEYCVPRILMETQLHDENCVWNSIYHSSALSKDFYVQSISTIVKECNSNIIFKEL